jgi:hypothetical protein
VLVLGATVVRNAIVANDAETNPQLASKAWPSHPSSQLWAGLTQIGAAARERKPAPESALALIRRAAVADPLAAEPFAVRGVQAQVSGDRQLAVEAFQAAALRDGRSLPARYFLAEQYLRAGDAARGLKEIAVLARMVPNGVDSLGPYVAAYAKDPTARPQMLSLFRSDPRIELSTLTALSADAENADLIMALATPAAKAPQWAPRLLESLVEAGEFGKARTIWASLSHLGEKDVGPIFDPRFQDPIPPAPFNWSLTSSSVGLAERQPGGRLHVLYYGQDDGTLASQTLVLKPGRYRLTMHVSGDLSRGRALSWMLICGGSPAPLLSLPLASASLSASFDVPANCAGQTLALTGRALDLPQQADVTISELSLDREQAHG